MNSIAVLIASPLSGGPNEKDPQLKVQHLLGGYKNKKAASEVAKLAGKVR